MLPFLQVIFYSFYGIFFPLLNREIAEVFYSTASVHLFLCLWVRLAKFVNTTKQLENLTGVWTNGLAGGQEGRGSGTKGGRVQLRPGLKLKLELSLDMCAILMRQLNVVVVHSLCCCFFPVVCHKFFLFCFFSLLCCFCNCNIICYYTPHLAVVVAVAACTCCGWVQFCRSLGLAAVARVASEREEGNGEKSTANKWNRGKREREGERQEGNWGRLRQLQAIRNELLGNGNFRNNANKTQVALAKLCVLCVCVCVHGCVCVGVDFTASLFVFFFFFVQTLAKTKSRATFKLGFRLAEWAEN